MSAATAAGGALEAIARSPYAQARIFCFPYAGGRAQAYASWAGAMPHGCELSAFTYPGRGSRLRDRPLTSARALAGEAADALEPRLDLPFAFFGHSMGALIAFETARALRDRGGPLPSILMVAGQAAPHLSAGTDTVHDLPDDEFQAHLRQMGGTPPEILESDELMRVLLPSLRADFQICDTYAYSPGAPLELDVRAYAAVDDREASLDEIEAWREHGTGEFALELFAGGHFFIHTAGRAVAQSVAEACDGLAATPRGAGSPSPPSAGTGRTPAS
ncbi:MAG: thioesterase II family protein [Thermoleophilaceae bacterium]